MILSDKEKELILLGLDCLSESLAAGNMEEEDEEQDLFGRSQDLIDRFMRELKIK